MSREFIVKGYRVTRKVEQSAFRTLYRGTRVRSGEEVYLVAISVRPGKTLELLTKRAGQAKQLTHPQLVSILDFGTASNGAFYYTCPAYVASSVQDVLEQFGEGEERWFALARYMIQALEVVDYIHQANLTHRDLTTAHLRVDEHGNLFVAGFINGHPRVESRNIAAMVDRPYMAAELLAGGASADRKTDLFSMGVVFYELITGVVPFTSNYNKLELAKEENVPSLSLHRIEFPAVFEQMVATALGPRRSRYGAAREWILELEEFYGGRPLRQKVKDFSSSVKGLFSGRS